MKGAAYKLVILLKTREGISAEAFTDAWERRERDDPATPRGLVGYAFDAPLGEVSPIRNAPTARFDAAIETWWDRKNSAADWVVSSAFHEDWLPARLPLLDTRPAGIGGVPRLLRDAGEPTTDAAVTLLVLPVATRRLQFDEFAQHWTGEHARLALSGPGTTERVVRLENTPAPQPTTSRLTRTRFDGVGAITFASPAALAAEFDSDHYRAVLAPDERRFTNPSASAALLTRPHLSY